MPDPEAVLVIRRAVRSGDPWSGHLALPGGRQDPADEDLRATAIREAAEEVGLVLDRSELARTLDDVIPRTPTLPPIAVRPFVFRLQQRPVIVPNIEVAAAEWIELAALTDPAAHREIDVDIAGTRRRVQAYVTRFGNIWGMTERILTLLLA